MRIHVRVDGLARRLLASLLALGLVCAGKVTLGADLDGTVLFDIKAQRLSTALVALSEQAHIQVMASGADLSTLMSPEVKGRLTVGQALNRLLAGTRLHYSAT